MKQVLLIAHQFPPLGGGGVQRTTKFLKYLPTYDWQGTVLTSNQKIRLVDTSLLADIPPETRIERVRGLVVPHRPSRLRQFLSIWILTVDQELGWLPAAVRRGQKVLSSGDYSIIYSTSAPYTDHLVALLLKKRFQLPWVADFRDPWVRNIVDLFPTSLHRKVCQKLEKKIVENADRVLVVSEPMRQLFIDSYPMIDPSRFITITNGFDEDDYIDIQPADLDQNKFHLVYTGTLYGQRTGRYILQAVRQLLDQNVLSADQFCIWFIGGFGLETPKFVAELELDDVVELVNYLPHDELVSYQLAADALLIIIRQAKNSEIILTGKVFEYISVEKPILGLVPPGAAADLLQNTNTGIIVPPDDIDAISVALTDLFQQWQHGKLAIFPNHAAIAQYSRRNLTGKLVDIFEELL